MPNTYTQIASDNFTRANQNPIGGVWSTATTGILFPAQLLSNSLQASADDATDTLHQTAWYTGRTWPADQYNDATVGAHDNGVSTFLGVAIRAVNGVDTLYELAIGSFPVTAFLVKRVATVQTLLASNAVTVSPGDVFRLAVAGTTLSAFQNGVAITGMSAVADSSLVTGIPSLFLEGTAVGAATVSNFVGGAVNATSAAASGTPQSAVVNTDFRAPIVVNVKDSSGANLSGVTVTFAAPGAGASCIFAGGATATTDSSGNATTTITANGTAGSYVVTGTADGLPAVNFNLTNADVFTGTVQQGEVHIDYSPVARINSVGANRQTGDVPNSSIQEADNVRGSNVVNVPNQSSNIVVTAPQGIPQPGQFGTVHGRLDAFNVLNNPA